MSVSIDKQLQNPSGHMDEALTHHGDAFARSARKLHVRFLTTSYIRRNNSGRQILVLASCDGACRHLRDFHIASNIESTLCIVHSTRIVRYFCVGSIQTGLSRFRRTGEPAENVFCFYCGVERRSVALHGLLQSVRHLDLRVSGCLYDEGIELR